MMHGEGEYGGRFGRGCAGRRHPAVRGDRHHSTGASTALYGSTIKVTAHLGSTHTNRTVSISASFPGSRTVKVLKTAMVNSAGNRVVSYPDATRNVVFTVKFGGDAEYAPTSVTVRVGLAARVSMSNSGWYTSASY